MKTILAGGALLSAVLAFQNCGNGASFSGVSPSPSSSQSVGALPSNDDGGAGNVIATPASQQGGGGESQAADGKAIVGVEFSFKAIGDTASLIASFDQEPSGRGFGALSGYNFTLNGTTAVMKGAGSSARAVVRFSFALPPRALSLKIQTVSAVADWPMTTIKYGDGTSKVAGSCQAPYLHVYDQPASASPDGVLGPYVFSCQLE